MIRLALIGAGGRLGSAIAQLAKLSDDLEICATPKRGEKFAGAIQECDVAIDVSQPEALEEICAECVAARKPLVIGTTGYSATQDALIARAAESIALLRSSNFSVGVNTLFFLARAAAKALGPQFEVRITETHHVRKKDAPSGTAKTLAQILAEQGSANVAIESIREGDVIGEHTLIFAGPNERLELKHSAESREIFARGALVAARWLAEKSPGLYSMENALGLSA